MHGCVFCSEAPFCFVCVLGTSIINSPCFQLPFPSVSVLEPEEGVEMAKH
jgi:hypothetical protein